MENLTNTNLPPQRPKTLSAFMVESPSLKKLLAPIPNEHCYLTKEEKIRRLYWQASMEQWFPPERLNFDAKIEHPEEIRKIWHNFYCIFYTLERMGLRTIQRMTPVANDSMNSNEVANYLGAQVFDEARHVFCAENYIRMLGKPPEFNRRIDMFEKISSMGWVRLENWLFSTLFSESFASAFIRQAKASPEADQHAKEMCQNILRDESRHLHFLNLVLPDLLDRMGIFKRTYVKASQYFIMRFTEHFLKVFGKDADMVSISSRAMIEEAFENVEKTYELMGVTRDYLWFPKISPQLN